MKAVVQTAVGEPADVLDPIDIGEPAQLAPGEVLVDVTLAPVHHGDLQLIRAQPGIPDDTGPVRRGSEAAGIVRGLGAGAEAHGGLKVGDRVIAVPAAGSWAESVVIPASAAIPVPPGLDDETAAQLMINYVAARMILRGLRKSVPEDELRKGAILVTGAGSVVAQLLLHMLMREGSAPIGLSRGRASARRVMAALDGAKVAATEDADWPSQVASLAEDRKIVGVLDCVSGGLVREYAPLLSNDAAIVTYGALGGADIGIGAPDIVARQFVIRGVVFTRWFTDLSPDEQAADIRSAIQLATELPPLFRTGGVYPLAEVRNAVAAVEAPQRDGFIFLRP